MSNTGGPATTLRQAAQQALEALESRYASGSLERCGDAITALRAALAEQCPHGVTDGCKECYVAEQEPVAWIDPKHLEWLSESPDNLTGAGLAARQRSSDMVPLYTTSPQRKPLTKSEIEIILSRHYMYMEDLIRAVEAAHNIKEGT